MVKKLWTPEVKRSLIRGLRVLAFGVAAAVIAEVAKLDPVKTSVIGTALIAVVDKLIREESAK